MPTANPFDDAFELRRAEQPGTYVAREIPVRVHDVLVATPRHRPARTRIQVRDGAKTAIQVTLREGLRVELEIVFVKPSEHGPNGSFKITDATGSVVVQERFCGRYTDPKRCALSRAVGLAPGRYRIQVRDFQTATAEHVDFEVTSETDKRVVRVRL